MQGLNDMYYHLAAIGSVWIAGLVAIWLCGFGFKRSAREFYGNTISPILGGVRIIFNGVMVFVVVMFALFIYNPLERTESEMEKVTPAKVDVEYEAPTKEEITTSNKILLREREREVNEKAEMENIKAMRDALKLFDEEEKKAEASKE